MQLHKKIKEVRRNQGLSLKELHRLIINGFKDGALTYRTLQRIEAGDTQAKDSSLHQIGAALGLSLNRLKDDTDEENKTVDYIKRGKTLGRYIFNEKAYGELLIRQNRKFMVMQLVLKAKGRTFAERDPQESEKYVYCLKGSVALYIGKDKFNLAQGDGASFKSSLPHYFENTSKALARCLIFQNPRRL